MPSPRKLSDIGPIEVDLDDVLGTFTTDCWMLDEQFSRFEVAVMNARHATYDATPKAICHDVPNYRSNDNATVPWSIDGVKEVTPAMTERGKTWEANVDQWFVDSKLRFFAYEKLIAAAEGTSATHAELQLGWHMTWSSTALMVAFEACECARFTGLKSVGFGYSKDLSLLRIRFEREVAIVRLKGESLLDSFRNQYWQHAKNVTQGGAALERSWSVKCKSLAKTLGMGEGKLRSYRESCGFKRRRGRQPGGGGMSKDECLAVLPVAYADEDLDPVVRERIKEWLFRESGIGSFSHLLKSPEMTNRVVDDSDATDHADA